MRTAVMQDEEARPPMKLEELQTNTAIRGIVPDALVPIVSAQWFGSARRRSVSDSRTCSIQF